MKIFNVTFSYVTFSLQRLLSSQKYKWIVFKGQRSFTTDHLQLASHVNDHFYLKNKFILCPEFGERSQNVCKREVLHHFNIQISWQLCFTCLKGQQRFFLLNMITRNHLQLTDSFFTTLHLNQGQRLRSKIILRTISQAQQLLNLMSCHFKGV
jgi:hypothetical protein